MRGHENVLTLLVPFLDAGTLKTEFLRQKANGTVNEALLTGVPDRVGFHMAPDHLAAWVASFPDEDLRRSVARMRQIKGIEAQNDLLDGAKRARVRP